MQITLQQQCTERSSHPGKTHFCFWIRMLRDFPWTYTALSLNDPFYSKGTRRTARGLGTPLVFEAVLSGLRFSDVSITGCCSTNVILKEKPKLMVFLRQILLWWIFWLSVSHANSHACVGHQNLLSLTLAVTHGSAQGNHQETTGEEESSVRGENPGRQEGIPAFIPREGAVKIRCVKATNVRLPWVPEALPRRLLCPGLCDTCLELGQEEMGSELTHGCGPAPLPQGWSHSYRSGFLQGGDTQLRTFSLSPFTSAEPGYFISPN